MTIRRAIIAVAVTALIFAVARLAWINGGGTLHADRLKIGMTKAEARAAVGPPKYISPDGTYWTIIRPGSAYWLDLVFGPDDRLVFFKTDCF